MAHGNQSISDQTAATPRAKWAQLLRQAMPGSSEEQISAGAEALGKLVPDPDQTTANRIWLIVIWAVVIVMIGSVLVLSIGVWLTPETGGTKPETILTVFTTVTAFLAGLLAESPVKTKGGG